MAQDWYFGLALIVWLLALGPHSLGSAENPPASIFRVEPVNVFTKGKQYYRLLYLDKDTSSLYVGAMNAVYKVWIYNINDTSSGSFFAEQKLLPSSGPAHECSYQQENTDYSCQNHVRVLFKLPDNTLYVCGTNAFKPMVVKLDAATLSVRENDINGAAICPVDPDDNGTAVWVDKGNPDDIPSVYSGTVTSKTQSDRVIYRPDLKDPAGRRLHGFMRTMHTDSKWLNEPHFVNSFDLGDQYVYFFFREPAIEYTNCGKTVYSRVARVCKNDVGGRNILQGVWATFLKARLNCSIPGQFPFYFDELQAVEQIIQNGEIYFYATFTTSLNGFYGSAVCMYSLRDINYIFDQGHFKEQKSSVSAWVTVFPQSVPSPRPGQCVENTRDISDSTLNFIKSHPFMDELVPTYSSGTRHALDPDASVGPLFYKRDFVFTKLAIDLVTTNGKMSAVLFVATGEGGIYKLIHRNPVSYKPHMGQIPLLSVYKLTAAAPIRAMQILHNEYLYVAQDWGVSQVSVDQCAQYKLCTICVSDPYCSWNSQRENCVRTQESYQYTPGWIGYGADEKCPTSVRRYTRLLYPGDALHLECPHPNGQQVYWRYNNSTLEISPGRHLLTVDSGLVIVNISRFDAGVYDCAAQGHILVSTNLIIDDVNCQRPHSIQAYHSVYREWCREFQEYKSTMLQWRQWYEDNSQCANSPGFSRISAANGKLNTFSSNSISDIKR